MIVGMQAENDRIEAAVSNLRAMMSGLPAEGKEEFCEAVGVKRTYIYRIIGGHIHNMTGSLLFRIEDAARAMHDKYGTPIVTARELAEL